MVRTLLCLLSRFSVVSVIQTRYFVKRPRVDRLSAEGIIR